MGNRPAPLRVGAQWASCHLLLLKQPQDVAARGTGVWLAHCPSSQECPRWASLGFQAKGPTSPVGPMLGILGHCSILLPALSGPIALASRENMCAQDLSVPACHPRGSCFQPWVCAQGSRCTDLSLD